MCDVGSSTVVKQSTHVPKFEGSNLGLTGTRGREFGIKNKNVDTL
jgi:hypothetical protein